MVKQIDQMRILLYMIFLLKKGLRPINIKKIIKKFENYEF